MKNSALLLIFVIFLFTSATAQEFANFELSSSLEGTGTFNNGVLSDFNWIASGTIKGSVQILDDEVFKDGSVFENTFGQADNAENLRIQIYPNGSGTNAQPIVSKSRLIISFDQITPVDGWGFCLVDIDVENCLISAIDENDNVVSAEDIDKWLIELFDTDSIEDGINIPKWDTTHAVLLGSDTPEDYVAYDSLVIGGLPSSEAPSAFFMPDIPLKTLTIDFESLQESYYTSYHFYIAALNPTTIDVMKKSDFEIFPNPVKESFEVHSQVFIDEGGTIEIYDLKGRKLTEKHIPAGTEIITINVSNLVNGIYYCAIHTKDRLLTRKIIIQK